MKTIIQVRGLTKAYGQLPAVDHVSLSVKAGTVFGLLGANGAGKSTTIECILGTKKADSGEISILSLDPQKDRRHLFQRVGVQFQECDYQPEIKVSELCEETVCLYKNPADWKKLCTQFGLANKTILALIPNPQVVFLDELTTGLDTKARRDVWKILEELKNQGMTIFLTSHFMDEVEALCDEICIIKKGKIVFYGTIMQAIEKSGCEKFEDAYLALAGEEVDAE